MMQNSRFLGVCRRLPTFFYRLEDGMLVMVLSSIILLATAQIIMRNLFDSGVVWIDPLLRILVLWLALLGAMVASRIDRHIRIDLVSRVLPENVAATVRAIVNLFAAAVSAIVAWHALHFVGFDYQDKIMAFAKVPAWCAELIIPLCFAVIALRFFLLAIGRFATILQTKSDT